MLRIQSNGAGVQSTALLMMAIEGELPKPDHAIFADTGAEPDAVYQHLTWLEQQCADAGITMHRVSGGDMMADALDPDHRFASMPLFVQTPNGQGMVRRQCTNEYELNESIPPTYTEFIGHQMQAAP